MNTNGHELDWEGVTHKVVGCAFDVSNVLGCGFLEKPYENALAIELRLKNLKVEQQKKIEIRYKGAIVGEYVADLLVENCVIVELKCVRNLDEVHMAQCLNYLKATGLPVCMLFNFSKPKLEFKRILNQVTPSTHTERLVNPINESFANQR